MGCLMTNSTPFRGGRQFYLFVYASVRASSDPVGSEPIVRNNFDRGDVPTSDRSAWLEDPLWVHKEA